MNKLLIGVLLFCFISSGCAPRTTAAGYYWASYSATLYDYTKEPSPETLNAHIAELNEIIDVSNDRGFKVPPGIYAELAYIEAKRGNNNMALALYQNEVDLYPEAKLFVERMISRSSLEES